MKKFMGLIAASALVLVACNTFAAITVTWGYAGDLQAWDATVQQGWMVQMFHDDDGGGFGDLTIGPGGVVGGDQLVTGASQMLVAAGRSGGATWGATVSLDPSYAGEQVYSVLFDSDSLATASRYVIIDSGTAGPLPQDTALYNYTLSTVNGTWEAVPEPGTIALLVVGVATLGIGKRFSKK